MRIYIDKLLERNGALKAFPLFFVFFSGLMLFSYRSHGCAACAGRMDDSNVQSFVPRGANGKPVYYNKGQTSDSESDTGEKAKQESEKSKEDLAKEKAVKEKAVEDQKSQKKTDSP